MNRQSEGPSTQPRLFPWKTSTTLDSGPTSTALKHRGTVEQVINRQCGNFSLSPANGLQRYINMAEQDTRSVPELFAAATNWTCDECGADCEEECEEDCEHGC